MDKEKINKAAETHAQIMGDVPAINSTHAFKAGADWLMQQPLSERLTEAEKERIRDFINAERTSPLDAIDAVEFLDSFFGADLFKEK